MKRSKNRVILLAIIMILMLGAANIIAAKAVSNPSVSDKNLHSTVSPVTHGQSATAVPEIIPTRIYLTAPPDLPSFSVEKWPGDLADGYLFVSAFKYASDEPGYNLILDNNGEPVYYQHLTTIRSSNDFKRQPNGYVTYYSPVPHNVAYAVMGTWYRQVKEYRAGNDPQTGKAYTVDNHGFQLLENGHALFMIHDTRIVDMSALVPGGSKTATVVGCIIQEVDQDNNVVFQWRSWDHIPITDTYAPLDSDPLRYIHCNSIEQDSDGNLLLSSRNLNEITKIDRQTGEIIWRLGGRNNEFSFADEGDRFSEQHDARRLPDGHITVYDNADSSAVPRIPARGLEYRVDEVSKTVTKMAEFRSTASKGGGYMGNMQRLPNGNTLIGWGESSEPMLTEFDGAGNRIFELASSDELLSYRAFRFPWHGFPQDLPLLAARREGNRVHLHFSWNGSTETAAYLVNAAHTLQDIVPVARVERDGFETVYSYELPESGLWYFRVRAISRDGTVGPPSDYAALFVGHNAYLPIVAGQ